jgi:hypothetical protein
MTYLKWTAHHITSVGVQTWILLANVSKIPNLRMDSAVPIRKACKLEGIVLD